MRAWGRWNEQRRGSLRMGSRSGAAGGKGRGPGEFVYPLAVALDGAGQLHVLDGPQSGSPSSPLSIAVSFMFLM